MRKIETEMNEAIRFCLDWNKDNTRVVTTEGTSKVYLHGNLIAEVSRTAVTLFDGGWQTTTTKSRLNAILAEFVNPFVRVFQKDFTWYVKDEDKQNHQFQNGYCFS